MAQATRKKTSTAPAGSHAHRGLREGALLLLGAIAVYLLISLATYHPSDPGWSHSAKTDHIGNAGGVTGAWFADFFLYVFGYMAYLFPVIVGYVGWVVYRARSQENGFIVSQFAIRMAGFAVAVAAGAAIAALHFGGPGTELPLDAGGILGELVGTGLVKAFSFLGATLFLLALFLTGITLLTGLSWLWVTDETGRITLKLSAVILEWARKLRDHLVQQKARAERAETVGKALNEAAQRPPPRIEPVIKPVQISSRAEKERQVLLFEPPEDSGLPPLSLLDPAEPTAPGLSHAALEAMSRQVELKLKDFGIEVRVVEVHPGPVITRFEVQPAPGVKVNQITNLAKDLARALSVISVRVVEVIPGKSVIGLEIPNEHREIVRLGETLQSKAYESMDSPIALALGKDIGGHPIVVDLGRMPHLLVAGTTGSGKSVALNAMVLSLLYNATPKEVRLIMIDPKMLELSVYEGIPHLLTPVVTDTKDAANALRWCVAEMENRYRLMAALGVRNIAGFNRKVRTAVDNGNPIPDPLHEAVEGMEVPTLRPLPYIVVIVDELADLMMMVGKKVEELIARLAQKARASGIHLILATQRPSVDVITGLIKANIPSRIAFQVSAKVDSRTILDQMGAEQLLGHGDMLYLPPGTSVPIRVHGAFVADDEVHKVVKNLKTRSRPDYNAEILQGDDDAGNGYGAGMLADAEHDPLYDQAVHIVTETRRASISGIQRRLKIGYNRAARMVEQMEQAGVVGPLQSNGNREVLAPPAPE